ncbi:MAG: hypothetical protein SF029_08770 [bacterium]|nr:hypothetical protein [bacterium]
MDKNSLLEELTSLVIFAEIYFPLNDPRPKLLSEKIEFLRNAKDGEDGTKRLKDILRFLTGGQGSFTDIILQPPKDSSVTSLKFNQQFVSKVNQIFITIENMLKQA